MFHNKILKVIGLTLIINFYIYIIAAILYDFNPLSWHNLVKLFIFMLFLTTPFIASVIVDIVDENNK